MGFWSSARDLKNVVAFENSPNRDKIQEWDCFDDDVRDWAKFFRSKGVKPGVNENKLDIDIKDIFDSAMNGNGKAPAAKHSGGNCTTRAVELFNKYGNGKGVPFGAPMREGLALALGKKSSYGTKSQPKGCTF